MTKVYGGLGNQMFQYAAGLALARRLETRLAVDARWFFPSPDPDRAYELSCFGIAPSLRATDRLRMRVGAVANFREKSYEYDPTIEIVQGDVALDGYWQREAYFKQYASEVREAFRFGEPLSTEREALLRQLASEESVSVHVRRGDYTSPKRQRRFGLLPLAYYDAATAYVRERVPGARFTVFSDDAEWCQTHLGGDFRYLPPASGPEDMRLMASCKHHVVANSSFSWWGAWLGANPDKIVVAPKEWFAEPSLKDTTPAVADWIQL